ncbi:MAG: pantetheine-phosphate adenylyltransferase [Spirochaetales bacterium]
MLRALFPGSFDPPTNGHLNILERASQIFDAIDVVVAVNPNKSYTFDAEERERMMQRMVSAFQNVEVHIWDQLIVKFAERVGARVMIRGVRALADFAYEFELSMINKGLNAQVETFFIPTDSKYFVLRSTSIKELARLGGDISTMVPTYVADALRERLGPEARKKANQDY